MKIEEHVSLQTLTSLRVGGTARYVYTCTNEQEIREAVLFAHEHKLPWYVLGEGTNVLAPDEGFEGVIIRPLVSGIQFQEEKEGTLVTAGAGETWDTFVDEVGKRGLWGVENLAGIPGTVGAAPIQNIGAYGTELQDTFLSAEVLNTETGQVEKMEKEACVFGYRDSIFKHNKKLVVLSVVFQFKKNNEPKLSYKDLVQAQESGADLSSPTKVAEVVRAIRAKKFPDRTHYGTAGSFFKNPVISEEAYQRLRAQYGEVPHFSSAHGVKVPLAFILDTILHLRGYRKGNVWLFDAQPLVLVADEGASQKDIDELAQDVAAKVKNATNISIEREVRTLSVT